MNLPLPDCPHLPAPRAQMDWRALDRHGEARDAAFYLSALEYGHYLWRQRLPARAILCLDRALGADLRGDETVLTTWPLPYAAMLFFLKHAPTDIFLGNPRVHFQHYAGRMNEPRREQRRWRAWACWALTRAARPHFGGDPKHAVIEPGEAEIAEKLRLYGHPGEEALWHEQLAQARQEKVEPAQVFTARAQS